MILHGLAEYEPPTSIQDQFMERFAKKIDRELIRYYRTKDTWKAEIATIRQELNRQIVSDIPIASKRWRLKQLQKHWKSAADQGKDMTAARILRQAAEELGQIRVGVDLDVGLGDRTVSVGGQSVAGTVAGIPVTGVVLDGEG